VTAKIWMSPVMQLCSLPDCHGIVEKFGNVTKKFFEKREDIHNNFDQMFWQLQVAQTLQLANITNKEAVKEKAKELGLGFMAQMLDDNDVDDTADVTTADVDMMVDQASDDENSNDNNRNNRNAGHHDKEEMDQERVIEENDE